MPFKCKSTVKKALIVSTHIDLDTSRQDVHYLYKQNLMAHNPKAVIFDVVRKVGYFKMPIVLSGDLIIDLKSTNRQEFIVFVRQAFGLEFNNHTAISITRNNMTVFSRHNLITKHYILYFSYHRPLLSITHDNSTVNR